MTLAFIFFIIIIEAYVIWKRKNLFSIEILVIWLLVATLNQNLLDIAITNLELLDITKKKQMFWSSFFNRFLLLPLLIILFVDFYSVAKSSINKVILFITWIILMSFIDRAVMWLGILKYHKWETWWSLLVWLCIILTTLGCRKFLHYLLLKGNDVA